MKIRHEKLLRKIARGAGHKDIGDYIDHSKEALKYNLRTDHTVAVV